MNTHVPPRGVSFRALLSRHCRFILNADTSQPRYCGDRQAEGSSYCPAHRAICCTPVPPRRVLRALPPDGNVKPAQPAEGEPAELVLE